MRDLDVERDSFANFSWIHTVNAATLLTVSPFYHFNKAQYIGGPTNPLITTSDRVTHYAGGQVTLGVVKGRHNFNTGLYGFRQADDSLFRVEQTGANPLSVSEHIQPSGGVASAFLDEQYKPWRWLTLNAGLRLTHYSGQLSENAANPRLGATIEIPRLKWVLRGFYGYYYQPPPLSTIGGPLLSYAVTQGVSFLPVHGERDRQKEVGLSIPLRGWVADFAHFQTDASNFADHDVLGNSDLTLPLVRQYVRVRGWRGNDPFAAGVAPGSFPPGVFQSGRQGRGAITGGMTEFTAPAEGFLHRSRPASDADHGR